MITSLEPLVTNLAGHIWMSLCVCPELLRSLFYGVVFVLFAGMSLYGLIIVCHCTRYFLVCHHKQSFCTNICTPSSTAIYEYLCSNLI